MPSIKFDHCVIHVSNWERSNTFYRDVLGAELIQVGAGWSYRFGETQLNCQVPNSNSAQLAKIPIMPGGSDLCFIWPEPIHTAIAHLEKHAIQIESGPVRRFGSRDYGISVYFRDPDGSLMEFISYQTNQEGS